MKKVFISMIFLMSLSYLDCSIHIPSIFEKITIHDAEIVTQQAERYRLGMNIALIIAEIIRHTLLNDNQIDSFVNHNFDMLVHAIALIQVPMLTVGAVKESNLSLIGFIAEIFAITGIKGFWASICAGNKPRMSTAISVIAIILSAIVTILIFNALNPIIKKHYSASGDAGKRRVLRSLVLFISSFIVPMVCFCADSLRLFYFDARRMEVLVDISFWHCLMNNFMAELGGYFFAEILKEKCSAD